MCAELNGSGQDLVDVWARCSESNSPAKISHTSGMIFKRNLSQIVLFLELQFAVQYGLVHIAVCTVFCLK
jgi:hypothetical protein